jgi:hypothetical protein
MLVSDCKTLDEYIARYQVDGVMWKAQKLLGDIPETDIRRNDNVIMIANTLALIPQPVLRDDYAKKICKEHSLTYKTIEKLISDAIAIHKRKEESRKTVRKNKVQKLEGDVRTFPFFLEQVSVNKKTQEETFKGIKIDKYKFVQLLAHFGFTRYEGDVIEKDDYNFVRLKDNVISAVTRNQIIDHIEQFVKNEYDFERAGCEHTDSELLINTFYDQIRTVFSKDLFARVRTEEKIIINGDKAGVCYLYYENGFVEITKEGWKLKSYSEMEGSVWEHQMLARKFSPITFTDDELVSMGYFADFCFKIANQDESRFKALCCLIGYLIHDFYDDVLKAVLFTDSSLSEASEGRTGKTLLAKIIGQVRSYCEINGKDFDSSDKNKYEDAKLGTQVIHLNDVKHKGKNRFDFEDVFNDVTEGYIVNAKYMTPFRGRSKFIISTNKTLNIAGASQRDRIVEFEMSSFFGEHLRPKDYYGHWFIRDWDETEFNRFDNFMCFCAQMFFRHGLLEPAAINLGERKLMNHTSIEFLEFMDEIKVNLKETGVPWGGYHGNTLTSFAGCELHEFQFDKKRLYEKFIHEYTDFKSWLTVRTFNNWLKQFSELRLHVKYPKEWKSNGVYYLQFITEQKP